MVKNMGHETTRDWAGVGISSKTIELTAPISSIQIRVRLGPVLNHAIPSSSVRRIHVAYPCMTSMISSIQYTA